MAKPADLLRRLHRMEIAQQDVSGSINVRVRVLKSARSFTGGGRAAAAV